MIANNPCVTTWPGRKDKDGYPIARIGNKYQTVAKLLYQCFVGQVPSGHEIRHTCDNRECINVAHLITGTHAENMADKVSRGRCSKGESHGCAKFSDAVIAEMREKRLTVHEARERYGIQKSQYYRIIKGETRA